jgi:hypothetical protein
MLLCEQDGFEPYNQAASCASCCRGGGVVTAKNHENLACPFRFAFMNQGKPYKSALVAAMRKLLICMQSLSKNPNFVLE